MSASLTTRLDGKVALVTGSSRGMGRQNALELAQRGASLVINYSSSAAAASKVVDEIKAVGSQAIAIKADMSEPAQIATLFEQAVKHYGRLDIVMSNSGVESFGHISEVTPQEFDRVFSINTKGQFFVAQQAYKYLPPGGRLVMISSVSAQAKSVMNHSLYSASKAAIEALVRCFALGALFLYFGSKQITVNAIAPGGIKTDMYADAARKYLPNGNELSDTQLDDVIAKTSPLHRLGYPQDVSRVLAFLCSEDGAWMNGQTLTVSGGAAF
ncbi:hypothetical protein MMC20_007463 [Loxospora ochrophaea]|nr:hypothetical protein [Loxospora ochrophaea]